jgi:hypothetical protein
MGTSYDDLHRSFPRRDAGRIDPFRHIFERAMSSAILGTAELALCAWMFFEIAIRM